jgi:methylated-DNA-[protein]-cysteine S-methyltransferase
LTGLRFEEPIFQENRKPSQLLPIFEDTVRWLDLYFGGEIPGFTLDLQLEGTPFQREVWALLLTIPYGQTTTYGELAKQLAARRGVPRISARAVGGAVGRNPVALIVPCHRVIGAGGRLTGYAFGLDRKQRLLDLEKAVPGPFQ